ncbi:unnamed protein product [Thlaspi arvense]|uniref:HSF-type DNA-binding domain-containing protein n=1 Tax=Thlaspi arvense TaxID=13288 RepID=A0AAU9TD57_THLAR|nr:unnamed protein product [Thlaspi arvense]
MGIPKELPAFYTKVYTIVDDPSLDSIISWSESNNTFIVWDVTRLCAEILSKSVGLGRNYKRFVIELECHGFKRVIGNGHLDEYGHDDFVRGKPHLLKKMMSQAWTERMEIIAPARCKARARRKRIAPNLEITKARPKANRACAKAIKASVKVEDLLENLRI